MGQHYAAGTLVGTSPWVTGRNEKVYRDPSSFRPERWVVDGVTVTSKEVAQLKANFHPFSSGPSICAGRKLALMKIMITVARTLHRFELRRVPGPTRSAGSVRLGWEAQDTDQFQLEDAYVSLVQGPNLQFRKRRAAGECLNKGRVYKRQGV